MTHKQIEQAAADGAIIEFRFKRGTKRSRSWAVIDSPVFDSWDCGFYRVAAARVSPCVGCVARRTRCQSCSRNPKAKLTDNYKGKKR